MNQQFGQKTPGEDTSLSGAQVVSLLGFGAMLVGSFLPWVRADILEANGTEGEGVYTAALAVVGAVATLAARTEGWAWLALLVAGLGTLVSVLVWNDLEGFAERISGTSIQVDPTKQLLV